MTVNPGSAFYVHTGPEIPRHLCCILAVFEDPAISGAQCSLVTVTSVKPGKTPDPACLLVKGDHPFITKDSYANYREAAVMFVKRLEKLKRDGTFAEHKTMFSNDVLERLREGALKSDFAHGDLKKSIQLSRSP